MSGQKDTIRKNTPYLFFILIGIICLLFANIIQKSELWSSLFLNLGIVLIAVAIVEFLWKLLGGDPLLEAIKILQTSTSLLQDLDEAGIVRIYSERKKWEANLNDFLHYVESAREVDIMGNVLRNNWTSNQNFMEILERRTHQKECKFRILLLDPDEKSDVLKQRAKDEARWDKGDKIEEANTVSYNHMRMDIINSLYEFETIKSKLDDGNRQYLKIKLVNQSNIYCNIIRADDKIIVAKYLLSVRGSRAPTLIIRGKATSFYKIFTNEFESIWKRGVDWEPSTKVKEVKGG